MRALHSCNTLLTWANIYR